MEGKCEVTQSVLSLKLIIVVFSFLLQILISVLVAKLIIAKRSLLERYKKVQFSPKKYRYLEWTEGRGDNGKECTST